ncbi:proton-coupled folate transporter-like [Saccoglossus kowalevskii]|uniref:Proton-coupled folate transporter n=1 Tax=Saccoglossus kowalevskii TaxID=10224 RepID=A0ABM0LTW3_SACKO|nr:PREDICTED: proton-coupled folate transporter-like [Saccoglossus kowalevskii]
MAASIITTMRAVVNMEPVVFSIMFALSTTMTVRVQYIQNMVGNSYNYTRRNTSDCAVNTSDPNYKLGQIVNSEVSYWLLYFQALSAALTLFSGTLLGSYSERGGGRKVPLLIPLVGFTFYVFSSLVVMYFGLPLQYFFISEVIRGITGNVYTIFAMSCAYVSDISSKGSRTFRLIVLETFLFLGGTISQISTGYWIELQGFIPPTWLAYGLMIFSVFFVILWVDETMTIPKQTTWNIQKQFVDVARLFTKSTMNTSIELTLILLGMFVIFVVIGSSVSITMLYILNPPFCFTSVLVGYYQAILCLSNAIGLILGGKLLSCVLGDLGMAQTGLVSQGVSNVILALASSNAMIFIAGAAALFTSLSLPVLRSRLSKLYGPGKQAVLFTLLGCVQGLGECFAPLVFNSIYSATVEKMPSFVFYTYALILIVPASLIGMVQIRQYRQSRDIIEVPTINDDASNSW